jgi:hypothetical protein
LTTDAYAHPVEHVELVETHISWIFLTGDYAYKLKKPIHNEFIDYSSLDRRHHFCQEEVRLNGRFAPGLYLGVVPVVGTANGTRMSPLAPAERLSGEIIEWAVCMRQFPSDALLGMRLSRNEVTTQQIAHLAEVISAFHDSAETVTLDRPWGTSPHVIARATDNLDILERILPAARSTHLHALCRWTNREADRLSPVFEHRRALGKVRACHGDLHLGNVLLLEEEPVLFDGIEFNEGLRWIDVLSDVAFLWMDLYQHRRPDLAGILLNRYLELTGDYHGLSCFRWYVVYRALVRAKVAAMRAEQEADTAERANDLDQVDAYLQYAQSVCSPGARGIAITFGLSGSGKTFGTQSLSGTGQAIRVRSDLERMRPDLFTPAQTAEDCSSTSPPQVRYSRSQRQRVYAHLVECADAIVKAGFWAIVDATFLRQDQRSMFEDLAAKHACPLLILAFDARVNVLEQRIASRQASGKDASEADIRVLHQQLQVLEPLTAAEQNRTISVEDLSHRIAQRPEGCG